MDSGLAVRDGVRRTGTSTSSRGWLFLAAALAGLSFGAVTALVSASRTQRIDDWSKHAFRPHDEWGQTQLRYDHVVEGLRPTHLVVLLAVWTLVAALGRRSWTPLIVAVPATVATGLATWVVKVAMSRPDPTGGIADGGSYPSGHMAFLIVCGGLVVILLDLRRAWVAWVLLTAVAALMALSLLATTAHWLSDVVGGTLLGVSVIALTGAVRSVRRTEGS